MEKEDKILKGGGLSDVWSRNAQFIKQLTGDVDVKNKGNLQEQVNKLNEDLDNKLDNSTDVENAGKAVVVGEDGKLVFREAATTSSNPNLFDNPFFNVNSRNVLSNNANGGYNYTVDRWIIYANSKIPIALIDDGIIMHSELDDGETSDITHRLYQPINKIVSGDNKFTISIQLDKKITQIIAYYVYENKRVSTACYLTLSDSERNIYTYTNINNLLGDLMGIYIHVNEKIKIKAAKLELGSVSTLHLDTPPNPEEEKLRCMLSTADPNDPFANKKLQSAVGDEWDKDVVYKVGDMFIAGNTLWKTKVQHSGQIPQEGTYVEKTSVAKELQAIWNAINS